MSRALDYEPGEAPPQVTHCAHHAIVMDLSHLRSQSSNETNPSGNKSYHQFKSLYDTDRSPRHYICADWHLSPTMIAESNALAEINALANLILFALCVFAETEKEGATEKPCKQQEVETCSPYRRW